MKPGMLKSQFKAMEEPQQALMVDTAQTPEIIVEQIRRTLGP
jgi:gluconate kinase